MKYEFAKYEDVKDKFPGRPIGEEVGIMLKMIEQNEECVVLTYDDSKDATRGATVVMNYVKRHNLKVKASQNGISVLVLNQQFIGGI